MSLPTNNKNNKQQGNIKKSQTGNSKFIKANTKQAGAVKKVRSTGANRGS